MQALHAKPQIPEYETWVFGPYDEHWQSCEVSWHMESDSMRVRIAIDERKGDDPWDDEREWFVEKETSTNYWLAVTLFGLMDHELLLTATSTQIKVCSLMFRKLGKIDEPFFERVVGCGLVDYEAILRAYDEGCHENSS